MGKDAALRALFVEAVLLQAIRRALPFGENNKYHERKRMYDERTIRPERKQGYAVLLKLTRIRIGEYRLRMKNIPYARHGYNVARIGRVLFQFFSKIPHMREYRAQVAQAGPLPDMLINIFE